MPYILGAISYSIIFYIMMFYWNRYQQTQKQRKILRKYNGSGLSIEEAKTYIDQLFEKITKDDLYKDPFLDLKKLAELLSIPYYQLSQIINQHLGKNFTEFINEYRVNEAKRLLKNPANINETIENIAYDSGFNNPSSFYAAFKKIAQTTPTKYKKEQLKLP
ncbi:MAG: helix-turn-helix domain-containing protein [Bacteroidetes bacterium]|nr:helix-turn-helix domain-containing protein [Bacteroidota bacterium]